MILRFLLLSFVFGSVFSAKELMAEETDKFLTPGELMASHMKLKREISLSDKDMEDRDRNLVFFGPGQVLDASDHSTLKMAKGSAYDSKAQEIPEQREVRQSYNYLQPKYSLSSPE